MKNNNKNNSYNEDKGKVTGYKAPQTTNPKPAPSVPEGTVMPKDANLSNPDAKSGPGTMVQPEQPKPSGDATDPQIIEQPTGEVPGQPVPVTKTQIPVENVSHNKNEPTR